MSYIYIHAFLHFSLIFFFSTLNLISFWSSGQSRVRVVHFGAFALPQFVSKTAWQISRPESKIILGDLNCEICQNAKCLWTSEASHPPILPEDEDEIEVSSYCKDGVSLSTPPWRWRTRSVDGKLLWSLGGQDVFLPWNGTYPKKMLWKMISPSNLAILCMLNIVKFHLGNSFRVGPVKLMGLWNLWVVCRNLPSSNLCWKVASGKVKISTFFVTPNGPPFFFGSRDSEGEWIFKRYLHGDLLLRKKNI